MKTLYLECNMGAAGDMLAAALLELHPAPSELIDRLNQVGLPGVVFSAEPAVKCGITGTHFSVMVHGAEEESLDHGREHGHDHGPGDAHAHDRSADTHPHAHGGLPHAHHGLHDIACVVERLDIPADVQKDVLAVYRLIAEAEGHVHGVPVSQVHFHEVGTLDALADVTAVCLLFHELAPEETVVSPIHVGSGQVRCTHGILPVPAPATAYLLRDLPSYGSDVRGELCTPTGAALLRYFADRFGAQPAMRIEKIGYGMGKKDFAQANCVRAMLGDHDGSDDTVVELQCNLDDMTPERVGFATERLFEAGALDVYTIPIGMKKNRPGVLLTCMCRTAQREEMIRQIFRHTTTLGLRENICRRYTLHRTTETIESQYGPVRVKHACGWGTTRTKSEYEDLAAIARTHGISLQRAEELISCEYSPKTTV